MNKLLLRISSVLSMLLVIASLAACGQQEVTPGPGGTVPGISVDITASECPSVGISLNDHVTWTNKDNIPHPVLVEYPNGQKMVEFGDLQPGDSASASFDQAGEYSVFCSKDRALKGSITVNP